MEINVKALHESHINIIITNIYHLCFISSDKTLCCAHKPWFISCSDILPKLSMKVIYISVSILVISLNLISSLIYVLNSKPNKPLSLPVISVNFSDVLCGIYLTSIWIADLAFKNKFIVKEESWRSGCMCFTAFGLLIWLTLSIQFVLIFVSLSRLMIIIHPVDKMFKRTGFVLKSVISFILFSFLCALSVTLLFSFSHGILPISLCLPFVDPTNSILMAKIITWIFIITLQL